MDLLITILSLLANYEILNTTFHIIINAIFYLFTYIGIENQEKYGSICGIVFGIKLILNYSIQGILGIFLVMHSIKYLKAINKSC